MRNRPKVYNFFIRDVVFKIVSRLFVVCVFLHNVVCVSAGLERLPQPVLTQICESIPIHGKKSNEVSVYITYQVNQDSADFFIAGYRIAKDHNKSCMLCCYKTKKDKEILAHTRSGICNPNYAEPRSPGYTQYRHGKH
jgi:hypothetical protein